MTYASDKISDLVTSIYKTEFYVHQLESLCDPATLSTNPRVLEILNDFWFKLPDNRSIRTNTFFKLCDVIELLQEEHYNESDSDVAF